jgi:hypothetical protein
MTNTAKPKKAAKTASKKTAKKSTAKKTAPKRKRPTKAELLAKAKQEHRDAMVEYSPSTHRRESDLIIKAIDVFHFEIPTEKKSAKDKAKGGRPTAINDEIVRKLEYAFAFDSTVQEACIIAGIPPSTYYDFVRKYPQFSETVELLRFVPMTLIRQTLVTGAMASFDSALKYAAVKNKIEFSPKIELSHSGGVSHTHDVTPEAKDAVDKVFELFHARAKSSRADYVVIEGEV